MAGGVGERREDQKININSWNGGAYTPAILAPRRLRQESLHPKVNLGSMLKACLEKENKTGQKKDKEFRH
jgi:hypothetical protein